MNDELQIRAEDFKKAWPNALARAMGEASSLLAQLSETNLAVGETKDKMVKLAQIVPAAIQQAEEKLDLVVSEIISGLDRKADLTVARIADAESHLVDATHLAIHALNEAVTAAQTAAEAANTESVAGQTKFLMELKDERLALVSARSAADNVLASIHKAQAQLDQGRREFSRKKLWSRLFAKT